MTTPVLYLASRSPRRRQLLEQIGVYYELLDVAIDERPVPGEAPIDYVQRMALEKAAAGWVDPRRRFPRPVLGADTSVILGDAILGKPRDRGDALGMLAALSGRSHRVVSGVALAQGRRRAVRTSISTVHFRDIAEAEREAYFATGEPSDKAGGYAIQGLAAVFVTCLEGSYSGVMGMPLHETAELLAEFGMPVLR